MFIYFMDLYMRCKQIMAQVFVFRSKYFYRTVITLIEQSVQSSKSAVTLGILLAFLLALAIK